MCKKQVQQFQQPIFSSAQNILVNKRAFTSINPHKLKKNKEGDFNTTKSFNVS